MKTEPASLVIDIDDSTSAFLRSLVDLPPKGRSVDVPPMPTDLLHTSAAPQPDGSILLTILPSPAVLKWAGKVASECWPSHVRSLKVEIPR